MTTRSRDHPAAPDLVSREFGVHSPPPGKEPRRSAIRRCGQPACLGWSVRPDRNSCLRRARSRCGGVPSRSAGAIHHGDVGGAVHVIRVDPPTCQRKRRGREHGHRRRRARGPDLRRPVGTMKTVDTPATMAVGRPCRWRRMDRDLVQARRRRSALGYVSPREDEGQHDDRTPAGGVVVGVVANGIGLAVRR